MIMSQNLLKKVSKEKPVTDMDHASYTHISLAQKLRQKLSH